MLGSAGRSEFFAREASDYLRAFAPLLGPTPPEGDTVVRLARALRGAAMLAGPASYTRAASQLEHIARLVRDSALDWNTALPALREAHLELERLAALASRWDESSDRAAFALANRLRSMVDSAPPPTAPRPSEQSAQSIRTFVAREAAAVAGAAGEAARAVEGASAPPGDRLLRITHSMQSLRGLAGLAELAPLPDLLDATDTAVRELQRYPTLPPGAAELCATAAEAFTRVAREVAETGRPDPELGEAHRFADQLLLTLTGPDVVVSIDALDGGAPVLQRPEPRFAEALDLASLGERLRAGADQLRDTPARAAARLQALVLLAVLRDAPGGLGRRPAGRLIARLVTALAEAAGGGDPVALVPVLDAAGRHLAEGARGDLTALETVLNALEPDQSEPVPIDELLEAEIVVDITDLAPAPARPALDVPADRTSLERSLSAYSRMVRENASVAPLPVSTPGPVKPPPVWSSPPGPEPGGFDEMDLETVPIEELEPDFDPDLELELESDFDEPISIEELAPETDPAEAEPESFSLGSPVVPIESLSPDEFETGVVPIESLLYSGRGALERADQVRLELEGSLRTASNELNRVEPLVRELLDLVPLALVDGD